MTNTVDIKVPDLGGATDVEVIDVLVSVGDEIQAEDSLITVESDKASMDIPAPMAGKVSKIAVATGDTVNVDDLVITIEAADEQAQDSEPPAPAVQQTSAPEEKVAETPAAAAETPTTAPVAPIQTEDKADIAKADAHTALLVIGSGPGGYTAAFRAADLGLEVTLVEKYDSLGGVCLNVGCIPSKALLHSAAVISEAREIEKHGISFGKPKIDIEKLRGFKESVIGKLTSGLAGMAKARKVKVIHGLSLIHI